MTCTRKKNAHLTNPTNTMPSSSSLTQINKIATSPFLYQTKKIENPMPRTKDNKNLTSLAQTITIHDTTLPCQYQDQGILATGAPSIYSPRKPPRSPAPRTPPGYPTPRTPPGSPTPRTPPGHPSQMTPDPTSSPDPLPFPPGTPPTVFGWTADYFGMTSEEFQNFIDVMNK